MRLGPLLGACGLAAPAGAADLEVARIVYDSRKAGAGSLFVAIPGFHRDGAQFAADAVARGAVAVVAEGELGGLSVPVAVTEAMANAMLQGNRNEPSRTVQVRVVLDAERLCVDVTDEGVGFDLSSLQQSPNETDWFEREDGRGVFLMRTLMDRVESAGPDAESGHCIRLILHRT